MKKNHDDSDICILPWISLHIKPTGAVAACPLSDSYLFGNTNETSPDKILHSDKANAFRKLMIDGQLPSACSLCRDNEVRGFTSPRQQYNHRFRKHFDLVQDTAPDGSVREIRYVYLDLRLSNNCNLLCRTCNPKNSSSIAKEKSLAGELVNQDSVLVKAFQKPDRLVKFLKSRLEHVEEIYFAGGEPILIDEHYEVLETLIKKKMTHIALRYSTNMTRLKFGKRDIVPLWREFEKVKIKASLDGQGARAEYMRHGSDWKTIEKNRERLFNEAPHLDFYLAPTLQIFNSFHFPNFHLDWIKRGWASPEKVHFNTLRSPQYYCLTALPEPLKKKFSMTWLEYAEQLSALGSKNSRIGAVAVIHFAARSNDWDAQKARFRTETLKLDQRRGQSFRETFPELADLIVNT